MADLTAELQALHLLYGESIPPLPRQPRIAWCKFALDATLEQYAQRAANDRRFGYQGDLGALARHALSLFLMALAKSSGQDVSPVRFQMEILRQQREAEDYTAFTDYAQTAINEAAEYAKTTAGMSPASIHLRGLVATVAKHPSPAMRLRMQAYLTSHGKFVKMVRELGDEWLKSWLELAT